MQMMVGFSIRPPNFPRERGQLPFADRNDGSMPWNGSGARAGYHGQTHPGRADPLAVINKHRTGEMRHGDDGAVVTQFDSGRMHWREKLTATDVHRPSLVYVGRTRSA